MKPSLINVLPHTFGHQEAFFTRNQLLGLPFERLHEIVNPDYMFGRIIHAALTGTFDGINLVEFKCGSMSERRKYDSDGNVIESYNSKEGTTTFRYINGRLIWCKEPTGITWTFEYDGLNRILSKASDGTTVHREFTADNLIKAAHDGAGYHEYYEYNDKRNCVEFRHKCFSQNYVENRIHDDHNNVVYMSSSLNLSGSEYRNNVQHTYTYYDDGQLRSFGDMIIPFYEKENVGI